MSTALIAGLTIGLGIPTILGLRYLVNSKSNGQNMSDSDNGIELSKLNINEREDGHILVGGKKSRKQGKKRQSKKLKSKK
jgi:hypothetical protein